MIIERNIPINSRKRLALALNVAKDERDSNRALLKHNAEAVSQKWSVSRLAYSLIQSEGPSALGGILASVSSFFVDKNHDGQNQFTTILRTFLATFGKRILQKLE
ncbi:MAG: hypothetical protein Salg2KO_04520 [Salibacteraceae bacterium]